MKINFAFIACIISILWQGHHAIKVEDSIASFGFELYTKIIEQNHDAENVVVSPFSIHSALTMTSFGASGDTVQEMNQVLRLDSEPMEAAKGYKQIMAHIKGENLQMANKIYMAEGVTINPGFNDLVKENLKSEAENINFIDAVAARQKINDWVKDHTNGKIENLLAANSVNSKTRSVVVNALHFQSPWKFPFKESHTKKAKFWTSPDVTKTVDMMSGKFSLLHQRFKDFCVIELPYKTVRYSMLIFLPNKRFGLRDLEQNISSIPIVNIRRLMGQAKVDVVMPKFEAAFDSELNGVLEKMGAHKMFSTDANFSKLTSSTMNIDTVVHKTHIMVNEKGTEASSATAASGGLGGIRKEVFVVDRPFLYAIVDRRGVVYFMGRVVNP